MCSDPASRFHIDVLLDESDCFFTVVEREKQAGRRKLATSKCFPIKDYSVSVLIVWSLPCNVVLTSTSAFVSVLVSMHAARDQINPWPTFYNFTAIGSFAKTYQTFFFFAFFEKRRPFKMGKFLRSLIWAAMALGSDCLNALYRVLNLKLRYVKGGAS